MVFDIFYHDGIFYTRLKGEPDPLSLISYFNSLISHSKWSDFAKVLTNETAINYDQVKSSEILNLVAVSTGFKNEIKNASFAIYVNSNLNYGMARMWKAYIDTEWDAETGIFRKYKDALLWLSGK